MIPHIRSSNSIGGYKTIIHKNKKSKGPLSCYVTGAQRLELIKYIGTLGYIVFEYYIERSAVDGFDYNDTRVAKALGLSERQVTRTRRELIKHGWFLQSVFYNSDGKRLIMTFLGQAAVAEFKKSPKTLSITIKDSIFIPEN